MAVEDLQARLEELKGLPAYKHYLECWKHHQSQLDRVVPAGASGPQSDWNAWRIELDALHKQYLSNEPFAIVDDAVEKKQSRIAKWAWATGEAFSERPLLQERFGRRAKVMKAAPSDLSHVYEHGFNSDNKVIVRRHHLKQPLSGVDETVIYEHFGNMLNGDYFNIPHKSFADRSRLKISVSEVEFAGGCITSWTRVGEDGTEQESYEYDHLGRVAKVRVSSDTVYIAKYNEGGLLSVSTEQGYCCFRRRTSGTTKELSVIEDMLLKMIPAAVLKLCPKDEPIFALALLFEQSEYAFPPRLYICTTARREWFSSRSESIWCAPEYDIESDIESDELRELCDKVNPVIYQEEKWTVPKKLINSVAMNLNQNSIDGIQLSPEFTVFTTEAEWGDVDIIRNLKNCVPAHKLSQLKAKRWL